MANFRYITTATTTQCYTGKVYSVFITVNTTLAAGTVTVIDGTSGVTANVAIITNPVAGTSYRYWGLQNGLRIVTSAPCDITVSYQSNQQPR